MGMHLFPAFSSDEFGEGLQAAGMVVQEVGTPGCAPAATQGQL